jgi:NAD(P)-dependent dehydrogenase (short-subunit alcohol dehydrogenase family)
MPQFNRTLMSKHMNQKTMVITGGNRGIGLDITEAYVKAGYFVVVGARQELGLGSRFGCLHQ